MPGAAYAESVFINCPFDREYRPLLEALVFAVRECGFVPRSALEIDDGGRAQLDAIMGIIEQCRLGLHDLSRTEQDPATGLPRFNMPLELGLFLGARRFGPPRQRDKLCLILDRERYRFLQFCSDIAGQDIQAHDGEPVRAIQIVRDWLRNASRESDADIPPAPGIVRRYARFRADLPRLCEGPQLDPDDLNFNDYRHRLAAWLKANPR